MEETGLEAVSPVFSSRGFRQGSLRLIYLLLRQRVESSTAQGTRHPWFYIAVDTEHLD